MIVSYHFKKQKHLLFGMLHGENNTNTWVDYQGMQELIKCIPAK